MPLKLQKPKKENIGWHSPTIQAWSALGFLGNWGQLKHPCKDSRVSVLKGRLVSHSHELRNIFVNSWCKSPTAKLTRWEMEGCFFVFNLLCWMHFLLFEWFHNQSCELWSALTYHSIFNYRKLRDLLCRCFGLVQPAPMLEAASCVPFAKQSFEHAPCRLLRATL